ncbi:hypothetical protein G4G28_20615 [Massilia sp. Dwa41.01b]|uniref:hypothetical protein n=1 Tax=unclassified Massilia TaxID=2609279 RepID=UPI001601B88C|nr:MULTISPECIES: hypothetical protein [unclassified Massilia]QNA90306.1 hypothetical protein G4G28_20615 [Massilia sp. Dwa41.01b]QNB01206.1 hypothetical protein G4G31_24240 [Massilia sp. Se16.2.3]
MIDRRDILQFIFNAHLSLFNTRRDHEWRVIISAMILMGAVDATVLTVKICLSIRQQDLWTAALAVLFLSIAWYQWGVQVRNRVDRVAMDKVLDAMCNEIQEERDSPMRAGIDREDERMPGSRVDIILHYTYLWAFIPQMLVLLIAVLLSAYVPLMVSGCPRSTILTCPTPGSALPAASPGTAPAAAPTAVTPAAPATGAPAATPVSASPSGRTTAGPPA